MNSETQDKSFPEVQRKHWKVFQYGSPKGLAIPKHTLFFADGYHICAFLTAIYKWLIKYFSNQLKKVNVSALRFELEQMCKEYQEAGK